MDRTKIPPGILIDCKITCRYTRGLTAQLRAVVVCPSDTGHSVIHSVWRALYEQRLP
jgi:hypothetical protein